MKRIVLLLAVIAVMTVMLASPAWAPDHLPGQAPGPPPEPAPPPPPPKQMPKTGGVDPVGGATVAGLGAAALLVGSGLLVRRRINDRRQ